MRKKLGDLLIEGGAIDELQLKAALAHQRQWGGRLGRILVEMRFVGEQQICDAVARQLGLPSIRLVGRDVDPAVLKIVPQELCEKNWIFPVAIRPGERGNDKLLVAMSDPTNLAVIDELRFRTGKHVEVGIATDSQIDAAIRRHFYGESVADQRPKASSPLAEVQFGGQEVDLEGAATADVLDSVLGPPPPAGDRLHDLFGAPPARAGAGPLEAEVDALLGLSSPGFTVPGAVPVPGAGAGSDALPEARKALFAAPGGLDADLDDADFYAAGTWAPTPAPTPPGWAAPPPPAAPAWAPAAGGSAVVAAPVSAGGPPPGWIGPVPTPGSTWPGPAELEGEEPVWGSSDLLEEVETSPEEGPLVVGTLIPGDGELDFAVAEEEPGEFEPAGAEHEPVLEAFSADPVPADVPALLAALDAMAAGEAAIEPGRLVAALCRALIAREALDPEALLAELRR